MWYAFIIHIVTYFVELLRTYKYIGTCNWVLLVILIIFIFLFLLFAFNSLQNFKRVWRALLVANQFCGSVSLTLKSQQTCFTPKNYLRLPELTVSRFSGHVQLRRGFGILVVLASRAFKGIPAPHRSNVSSVRLGIWRRWLHATNAHTSSQS